MVNVNIKKGQQPSEFFIVRNDSASTHFTEQSNIDGMKQNSIYSFNSNQLLGSICQDKANFANQKLGGNKWTAQQEAIADDSFSDEE